MDSESIYLKNNVMSQENIDGPWGIVTTLYRDLRAEQMTPDVYLGKWLTLEDNTIAVKSGNGKLMFFYDSSITGATATSLNNIFYAPTSTQRIYSGPLTFSEWQAYFNDTTSQFMSSYPFVNDGTATVGFEQSSISVDESQGVLQIPVVLSKAVDANVTLNLNALDASATNGNDFTLLSLNTLTFRPLEREKVIDVLINRDYIDEPEEDFILTLSSPANATLSAIDSITITIEASNETLTPAPEKTHNAYNRIEAEFADDHYEVNMLDNVGFGRFRKNHWAMYQNVDFGTTGPNSVEISMAVPTGREGRDVEVRLDAPDGPLIATLTTYMTDTDPGSREEDWDVFGVHAATIPASVTGKHDVYIINNYDYTNACVVDWFVFKN
ncbi:MAG: carbohydrate-binding protein [gamma proteobacterium symbiont of Bathyaustriella thionipta]|nr:carbohydrate-binding protein [gamma proteobacterium symbiont of Bathyaustriella thionipta]